MKTQDLHNKAMNLADKADMLKKQGKEDEAKNLYLASLDAEREAAYSAHYQKIGEPTESVLFRSAASLAYLAKDYREAERLVCMGLAGTPPAEIADELRSLYETINMQQNILQMESSTNKNKERVTITIPTEERNLLNVIVKKFGWACIL